MTPKLKLTSFNSACALVASPLSPLEKDALIKLPSTTSPWLTLRMALANTPSSGVWIRLPLTSTSLPLETKTSASTAWAAWTKRRLTTTPMPREITRLVSSPL